MWKQRLLGLGTFIPGYSHIPILSKAAYHNTGGTDSASYCYSVWLRHLVMASRNALSTMPQTVAELGPGDSLGIGLAALLSGAQKYYAFDVVQFANSERNLMVFEELVELFHKRASIPDDSQFPSCKPHLDCYDFPAGILTQERLRAALEPRRIDAIRKALPGVGHDHAGERQILYFAPWDDAAIIKENSVDMIYSQAVLEHVDDLEYTYQTLYRWLKPGGVMSHEIDFKCHGQAAQWNGHWGHSDFSWRLIKGTRANLLNRQPHSMHVDLLGRHGFHIVCDQRSTATSGITRRQLSRRFQHLSDEDLMTSSSFMQAVKAAVPASVNLRPS